MQEMRVNLQKLYADFGKDSNNPKIFASFLKKYAKTYCKNHENMVYCMATRI